MGRRRFKKPVVVSSALNAAVEEEAAHVATSDSRQGLPPQYVSACRLAEEGRCDEARGAFEKLKRSTAKSFARVKALVENDLAALLVMEGRLEEAREAWGNVLAADPGCMLAKLNRDFVEAEISLGHAADDFGELKLAPAPGGEDLGAHRNFHDGGLRHDGSRAVTEMQAQRELRPPGLARPPGSPVRIAILSFLFNWPSTGGGNHHTAETARFLGRAGYEVKHFFAQHPPWGIGRVTDELISPSEAIPFDDASWNVAEIQSRFRRAVDGFAPDCVIITDSWNMKPLLAEALRGYPYFLLYQAQENLCPLNNLRLLATGPDTVEQCPRNQLATPEVCCRCLAERGCHSGALHRAERELAAVGTREYYEKLRRSLDEAEAVMVLNPVIEAMMQPFARRVCVVPWGMDAARFPWPAPEALHEASRAGAEGFRALVGDHKRGDRATLFMAAVAGETIKGYHVAHEACRILRETRSDFELVVTFDPPGQIDEFTRSVGWCSLSELPRYYREADVCLVPTIAQDSLSRTSVEAMASGIPVVASRIGGLPYTVNDGVTGLLFAPGDPVDLSRKIARLLDDPALRRRMGLAGRKRFEEEFVWEDVIERYFRPLLAQCRTPDRNAIGSYEGPQVRSV
jgi:glycosyltransferase involved in cell wall biosynthesis